MADGILNSNSINDKKALQAQARDTRALFPSFPLRCFSGYSSEFPSDHSVNHVLKFFISEERGEEGSATVEASLILPFFLCALCTMLVIAQFILAETAICHASVQTVRVYAKQETAITGQREEKDASEKTNAVKKYGGILGVGLLFTKYLDKKALSTSFVSGGRSGVVLIPTSTGDEVTLKVNYILKVPVPFFRSIFIPRTVQISCRKFSGYILHDSVEDPDDRDVVYVAEYGNVYHTSLGCSHLTIHITDPDRVNKIMKNTHYRRCEKCIRKGEHPSRLYITKDGDCYHSTLSCSGLKRSVHLVKKSDVAGMRICSECGKMH